MKMTYLVAFCLMLMMLFTRSSFASVNYTFTFPVGMNSFSDRNGNVYQPDANNEVTITNVSTVRDLLAAGFVLCPGVAPTVSHDYASAHADWTLNASEQASRLLIVSNASQAANIVALPNNGQIYILVNGSGYNITIKAAGQSGVTTANSTTTMVRGTGTDFAAVSTTQSLSAIDNIPIGGTTPSTGVFTTFGAQTGSTFAADFAGGNATIAMTAAQCAAFNISATNAATGAAIIRVPNATLKMFLLNNTSGQAVSLTTVSGTGISVANAKCALLFADGTNVLRVTADATP